MNSKWLKRSVWWEYKTKGPLRMRVRPFVIEVCSGNSWYSRKVLAEFPESEKHIAEAMVMLATEEEEYE